MEQTRTKWRHELLTNRRIFRGLEARALAYAQSGNVEQALRVAASVADWAWFNHTGTYVSRTLEYVLKMCGTLLLSPDDGPSVDAERAPCDGNPRSVLHVLTQGYSTGGHTRLAWRWMRRDSLRMHTVVLTFQGGLPIPDALVTAATGRIISLTNRSHVARVLDLAEQFSKHDLIVLHAHPHDSVAVATCAGMPRRPPTLYVNHADHVFWLGAAAADGVVNLRPSGESLSVDRRGIAPHRNFALPLPLDDPTPLADRRIRQSFGLSSSEIALLTVAQPYKYASDNQDVFVDFVADALAYIPNVHLFAVGPDVSSLGWRSVTERFQDRVHLLGVRDDLPDLWQIADIYLDSFPFTSVTSLLEASLFGIPSLCYQPGPSTPLTFDDFHVRPRIANTRAAWLAALEEWAEDGAARRSAGADIQAQTLRGHAGPDWSNQLERLYQKVRRGPAALPRDVVNMVQPFDVEMLRLHTVGSLTREAGDLLSVHGIHQLSNGG